MPFDANFCADATDTASITLTNYYTAYAGTSCITTSSDGTVTPIAVATLLGTGTNSAATPSGINPATLPTGATYATKAAEVRKNIENEYCYYYRRYIYAMGILLDQLSLAGLDISSLSYTTLHSNTLKLNSKLNAIILALTNLVNSRVAGLNGLYQGTQSVNQLNTQLDATRKTLLDNSTALKDYNLKKNVTSAMIDYTLEKNSSSSNLLAIYGFMNIVAIGMLYYLYRNSKA